MRNARAAPAAAMDSGAKSPGFRDCGFFPVDSKAARRPLRVLAACTPGALREVRTALGDAALVTAAFTLEDALRRLGSDTDVLACNVRFDQSRMFDLLHSLDEFAFRPPVICFRAAARPPLSAALRRAIGEAACALGAHAFIDLAEVASAQGREAAHSLLRETLIQAARARRLHARRDS